MAIIELEYGLFMRLSSYKFLLIRKNKDKKYVAAITTIELVLILVILIALLLIFKEKLISLITTIFEKVTSESSGI